MDWTRIILDFLVLIAITSLFVFRSFLFGYGEEKGRNLATKEDIAVITENVERVKSAITDEYTLLEKRRQVYEELAVSMRVFISGHSSGQETRETFHRAYASMWLWAPDNVIEDMNNLLQMIAENTSKPGTHDVNALKAAYARIIIEMRKSAGYSDTQLVDTQYRFDRFN